MTPKTAGSRACMRAIANRIAGAAMLIVGASLANAAEPTNPAAAVLKSHIMVTPQEVKWGPCSAALPPGAQCATVEGNTTQRDVLFTYRIRLPDNYRIAPHFHPADEHLTILAGTFNMGLGEKFDRSATHPLGQGSFAVMPKGTRHFAWTRGETILQVHAIGPWGITYVDPKDDPRQSEGAR